MFASPAVFYRKYLVTVMRQLNSYISADGKYAIIDAKVDEKD